MMDLSDISDDDKQSQELNIVKLEHELDRARLTYQINESIWNEKEESLNSIIAEQKQVISLLESLLKSNQQYYDELQDSTTQKGRALEALNDDIGKTLASTAEQINILTANIGKAEQALREKDLMLADYANKVASISRENASLQDTLKNQQLSTQETLAKGEESLQQAIAENQRQEQLARTAQNQFQMQLGEIKRQRDAFKRARDALQQQVDELKLQDEVAKKNHAALLAQRDADAANANKYRVELEQKLVEITRLYETGREARDRLEQTLKSLQSDKERLQKTIDEKRNVHQSLKAELAITTEQLKEALNRESEVRATLSSELTWNKNRVAELERKLAYEQERHSQHITEFKELEEKHKRTEINLAGLLAREQRYKKNISMLEETVVREKEKASETISYQVGYSILQAGRSFSGLLRLPTALLKISKDARARKVTKRNSKMVEVGSRPTVLLPDTESKSTASTLMDARITSENVLTKKLRIAALMDEFTYHSYKPEADILQLHPERWSAQLSEFKPDLLFIESAWNGIDGAWKGKISNADRALVDIIDWCRESRVPTLFWNKEDPVHFSTFLPIASRVDVIFTTDVDCLPKYKRAVGHDRVYLLPFAAQPLTHNPIEKYDRKDAFNFAGSYYLRYPERQRDFAALVDTVRQFRPLEIYDRNFENPHPHYVFPEKYHGYILGSLPFEEIDRAYKGYRYGINMNTIKQSQTMFARRVFELLASNTIVVSNFSRGVRLMFGDLVVSSDNGHEIAKRLETICNEEITYRKIRLLGLRKVMKEHTYSARLNYISDKLLGSKPIVQFPEVIIIVEVSSQADLDCYLSNRKRQSYANLRGLVVSSTSFDAQLPERDLFVTREGLGALLNELLVDSYIVFFSNNDYYGKNFIVDLELARRYTDLTVVGKASFYQIKSNELSLVGDGRQYKVAERLDARCSMSHRSVMSNELIQKILPAIDSHVFDSTEMVSLDEFNYCRDAGGKPESMILEAVNDLDMINQGMSLERDISQIAADVKVQKSEEPIISLPYIAAADLSKSISRSGIEGIQCGMRKSAFHINSTLPVDKHVYLYSRTIYTRPEMNMVLNSQFKLECEATCQLKTVFEFQDAQGKKIAHSMTTAGGFNSLAIPENCVKLRLGLRIQGPGQAKIGKLILGNYSPKPVAVVSTSPYLVLTKQYPDYDDLYKYGFLHTRVRAYREHGLGVDVFRIANDAENTYREFEGVDVVSGDGALLDATLSTGQYKNVLVHLLDEKMWAILAKYLDTIHVTVWVHGAEIQVWQRRQFEFERIGAEEIKRQKRLSDKRLKFWRSILQDPHPNLELVFVSKYFANEVSEDFSIDLSKIKYEIVHNYIDEKIFPYHEKSIEQRKRLLSIRPYASRKYANDLTVKAILELSKRSFFNDLEIALYGDGDLFEQITRPLQGFQNVKLHRTFLSHRDISALHKEYGVFLTPTRMDSQGVSRDEAMSSGLVPITTKVTAIPEFVDESCGMLVDGEDYIAMADAVEALYQFPEKFLLLSRKASERVHRQSGIEQTIMKEIQIITRHAAN